MVRAAARDAHTTLLSANAYMAWRVAQIEDARRRGLWRPIPEWKLVRDRFGSWPRALLAAGLITPEKAAEYRRGQGRRMPDDHIAKWLCDAATELGPCMTGDAYKRWRQKQIDNPTAGYPPSQRVLQLRFGRWSAAVDSADAALTAPRPFEHILEILHARGIAA